MASYKVPQDVEADDKLLGPFSFRQFVYLMIVFGMVMLAVGLYQIFPLLAVIPIPVALFFVILALPLKKDQPMETYLAAIISFHTKPHIRYWMPGQSESTILITAPKKVEVSRVRNISEEEAGHRLSFLAEIVDSEGRAIKEASSPMRDEFYAEAYNVTDMFDNYQGNRFSNLVDQEQIAHRNEVIDQMRNAIAESEYNTDIRPNSSFVEIPGQRTLQPLSSNLETRATIDANGLPTTMSGITSPTVVQPTVFPPAADMGPTLGQISEIPNYQAPTPAPSPVPNLESSTEQAERIRRENDSEVYVSLH